MTTHTTPLEKAVIYAIARNEMNSQNYGIPESAKETTTFTWTLNKEAFKKFPINTAFPAGKSLSAIISSLTKKGLIESQTSGPVNDRTIELTEEGFKVYISIEPETITPNIIEVSEPEIIPAPEYSRTEITEPEIPRHEVPFIDTYISHYIYSKMVDGTFNKTTVFRNGAGSYTSSKECKVRAYNRAKSKGSQVENTDDYIVEKI